MKRGYKVIRPHFRIDFTPLELGMLFGVIENQHKQRTTGGKKIWAAYVRLIKYRELERKRKYGSRQ